MPTEATMVDENRYQQLLEKWAVYEDRKGIVAEFLGEPSWWAASFVIDLYTKYGQEQATEFANFLMELEDAAS